MEYTAFTDKGSREINEDSIRCEVRGQNAIFALADGLGGHGYGDLASQTAVSAAVEAWENSLNRPLNERLEVSFSLAQETLLAKQRELELHEKARTTLVLLMIDNQEAVWGHIGDSRLYRFKHHHILERTLDHSVPQMLVNAGELKEKRIRGHEDRAILLRALGSPEEHPGFYQSTKYKIEEKDAFLLCSDGFWELIVEKNMEKLRNKTDDVSEWVTAMTEMVRKNGKNQNMDNYSAIGIMF